MRRGEHGGIFSRLLFLLLFLVLLAVAYSARDPLMRLAGELWVVDEPALPSDALIVLGDDNYPGDRAFHAAELYREKVAPVVVASGRMLRQNVGIADIMEHDLESFGVPETSIVKLSHRAENTREEAFETARLIQDRGWKRVTIVTSNYHARRTRFIYGRVLPSSVTFRVSGARDSDFDPAKWWQSRQGQKLFMTELTGYAVAIWELRNRPDPRNGAAFIFPAAQALNRAVLRTSNVTQFHYGYLIGNTIESRGSHWDACAYYSSQVTVLSGLLRIYPSLAATEFSVGKNMWRKPEDAKPAGPVAEAPTVTPAPTPAPRVEQQQPVVRSVAGLTAEVVQPSGGIITSTLLIKGEVRGSDDLYIDGEVQGTIHLSNGRVTVGPHGKISADVDAREIIVRGKVQGALRGRDRVEIGSTGEVRGDIATLRIAIGEGAQIHSKVEIARADGSQNNRAAAKSSSGAPAMNAQPVGMKARGENDD